MAEAIGPKETNTFQRHGRLETDRIEGGTEQVVFEFESDESGYVIFSMTYSPHWRATVNGQPRDIIRHENMIAVSADQGANTVEFNYIATPVQKFSLLLTILALIALGIVAYAGPKREIRQHWRHSLGGVDIRGRYPPGRFEMTKQVGGTDRVDPFLDVDSSSPTSRAPVPHDRHLIDPGSGPAPTTWPRRPALVRPVVTTLSLGRCSGPRRKAGSRKGSTRWPP